MSQKKFESFLPDIEVIPAANQLELHVYNPDHALVSFFKSKGILVQAYSPLGSSGSPLISDETVVKVAQKYEGFTPADILLGWLRAYLFFLLAVLFSCRRSYGITKLTHRKR